MSPTIMTGSVWILQTANRESLHKFCLRVQLRAISKCLSSTMWCILSCVVGWRVGWRGFRIDMQLFKHSVFKMRMPMSKMSALRLLGCSMAPCIAQGKVPGSCQKMLEFLWPGLSVLHCCTVRLALQIGLFSRHPQQSAVCRYSHGDFYGCRWPTFTLPRESRSYWPTLCMWKLFSLPGTKACPSKYLHCYSQELFESFRPADAKFSG